MVVCTTSHVEDTWASWRPVWGPSQEARAAETAAAMEVLGCDWCQMPTRDDRPDWNDLAVRLTELPETSGLGDFDLVIAPASEPGGHAHHNAVGDLAAHLWPDTQRVHYTTYTHVWGRSTWGWEVPALPTWPQLKREALNCYGTQRQLPETRMHFERDQTEYKATGDPLP